MNTLESYEFNNIGQQGAKWGRTFFEEPNGDVHFLILFCWQRDRRIEEVRFLTVAIAPFLTKWGRTFFGTVLLTR